MPTFIISRACLICPWGDQGAMAQASSGQRYRALAVPSIQVVDSLGAGDTFIAAVILSLTKGYTINKALNVGCMVAGTKCTMKGFARLGDLTHLCHDGKEANVEGNGIYVNGQHSAYDKSTVKVNSCADCNVEKETNGSGHSPVNGVHTAVVKVVMLE